MTLVENPNLAGLYPFLHGKKQDPLSMNSALLESVAQKAAHHHKVIDSFFSANGQR
jgi:D-sedoheptulose 7-phosphate isomerase